MPVHYVYVASVRASGSDGPRPPIRRAERMALTYLSIDR